MTYSFKLEKIFLVAQKEVTIKLHGMHVVSTANDCDKKQIKGVNVASIINNCITTKSFYYLNFVLSFSNNVFVNNSRLQTVIEEENCFDEILNLRNEFDYFLAGVLVWYNRLNEEIKEPIEHLIQISILMQACSIF